MQNKIIKTCTLSMNTPATCNDRTFDETLAIYICMGSSDECPYIREMELTPISKPRKNISGK